MLLDMNFCVRNINKKTQPLAILFFVKTLDKNIQMKIKNTKTNYHPDWWSHIDKDQIEEKYGGTMRDKIFESIEDLGI